MNGITACFVGHIGKDVEVRTTRDGKPMASFSVAVDVSGDKSVWVKVALFGDVATELAPRLLKGAMTYCEGRLSLRTWTGINDGVQRTGLSLAAWTVQPMAQIGRRRPTTRPRPQQDAGVPFDDAIAF